MQLTLQGRLFVLGRAAAAGHVLLDRFVDFIN